MRRINTIPFPKLRSLLYDLQLAGRGRAIYLVATKIVMFYLLFYLERWAKRF